MTHSATLLLLDALAVYRLTHLIIHDVILASLRDMAIGHAYSSERNLDGTKIAVAKRPRVAQFLSCPWCVSMWCALIVVLVQALAPALCLYATAVLAFSALAGLLSEVG